MSFINIIFVDDIFNLYFFFCCLFYVSIKSQNDEMRIVIKEQDFNLRSMHINNDFLCSLSVQSLNGFSGESLKRRTREISYLYLLQVHYLFCISLGRMFVYAGGNKISLFIFFVQLFFWSDLMNVVLRWELEMQNDY